MNSDLTPRQLEELAAYQRLIEKEAAGLDVRLSLSRHMDDFAAVDRGLEPSRIFSPDRQIGPGLVVLAKRGSVTLATWACIIFDTGPENMSDFLRHSSFYYDNGQDDWMFRGDALNQVKQMSGTIAYCGGLWVKEGHRRQDGSKLGPWWTANVGLFGRSIMASLRNPDWFWLISDYGKVADKCAPRYGLKHLWKEVDWLVGGRSYDGLKVLGLQDRAHLLESVDARLAQSRQ